MFHISIVKEWEPSQLVQLYKEAGWWKDSYDPEGLNELVSASLFFAVALEDGKAVGMGRVVSDGVSDGYIQDLAVLEYHRGQGIGRKLVERLRDECITHGLHWVGLFAEPGTDGFYEGIGFKRKDGYTLLIHED